MMMKKFYTVLFAAFFLGASVLGLAACGEKERGALCVVNWNLQTFFDAQTTGNEFAECRGAKSTWTTEKYKARVERVARVITDLDKAGGVDVFTFEEIENGAVLADISNELAGHLSRNRAYPYAAFATAEGSSIGCGVLSRYPIAEMTVHAVDARDERLGAPPLMRPLLELRLNVDNADTVTLFVAHWKSKVGGEDTAGAWQDRQARVLARRVALRGNEPNHGIIVLGDFNREMRDFESLEDGKVVLGDVSLRAGWLSSGPEVTGPGSYYFRGGWERIDHVFVAGNCSLLSFNAESAGPWAVERDGERIPYRYVLGTGKGYSDHLPVRCVVRLGN
jgi:endonuclease/exonuclease/phosphatase family metal-dependent hydrolase